MGKRASRGKEPRVQTLPPCAHRTGGTRGPERQEGPACGGPGSSWMSPTARGVGQSPVWGQGGYGFVWGFALMATECGRREVQSNGVASREGEKAEG